MERFLVPLFAAVRIAVNALLLFMTALVTAQVCLRGLTGVSIKWAEEAVLIAMVWVAFLTMALGLRSDIHIRIEMFTAWLPRRARSGLEFCLNLLLLFISAVLVYYGAVLTNYARASTLPATRLPTAAVYASLPIAGVFCLLHVISRLAGSAESKVAREFIDGPAPSPEGEPG